MSIQCAIATELKEDGVEGFKPFNMKADKAATSDHFVTLVGTGLVAIIVVFLLATSPLNTQSSPPTPAMLTVSRTPAVEIINTTRNGSLNSIDAAPTVAKIEALKTKAPSHHRQRDAVPDPEGMSPNDLGASVDSNAPAQLATLRELQSKM